MSLFDELVNQALLTQPTFSSLRNVVEKELLHHDILRIMRDQHLIGSLTFIGGTCLRLCYGGMRLSEDLDFTGGADFSRDQLSELANFITHSLEKKYSLHVKVSEPKKDNQDVSTWKINIETRPGSKNLPTQRINIDICSLKSYEKKPTMLMNPYGVDMGTSGLIIYAQSLEEIYADKLIAFALRPNRLKYRDLWDISWMHSQGKKPKLDLIPLKIQDRRSSMQAFLNLFNERLQLMRENDLLHKEFNAEMQRFLPHHIIQSALIQPGYWDFLIHLLGSFYEQMPIVSLSEYFRRELNLEMPDQIKEQLNQPYSNLRKAVFDSALRTAREQAKALIGILDANNCDQNFIIRDASTKKFAEEAGKRLQY